MKKFDVICFINSAGVNFLLDNLIDTMNSIDKNINTKYSFYIATDTEHRKNIIESALISNNLKDKVLELSVINNSWAKIFNDFFNKYKNKTKYILSSHDDLIVKTFDFFNITMSEIEGHEDEIAWIGYTSDLYYKKYSNSICQSAREMFCKDRFTWPKTFELHNMKDSYNDSLLDLPKRSCKVPGIFSHFNLIKVENLEKIGLCPNWGNYTLLIDEHWSLKTLINNMWTIWVPHVFYDHPIRGDQRTLKWIQNSNEVTKHFLNEWGYSYETKLTDKIINQVCSKYPNTNINFFNDKNTYDYQYLKN